MGHINYHYESEESRHGVVAGQSLQQLLVVVVLLEIGKAIEMKRQPALAATHIAVAVLIMEIGLMPLGVVFLLFPHLSGQGWCILYWASDAFEVALHLSDYL